jgi:hypothetical protein
MPVMLERDVLTAKVVLWYVRRPRLTAVKATYGEVLVERTKHAEPRTRC